MRRVFAKEWLQGRMIAMFGLLMGGLVTALWGIFTVAYVRDSRDQEAVNGFCGVMYYLVPLVLAVLVGSGLFAAEVERGTMPLLLALPFSRRQVWAGKTLAGLALMVCAVVLVLIPAVIAVRPALEEVEFWKFLPELALATALLYLGAVFWSTVLPTIMGALLSAVALVAGLVVMAIAMMVFGGRLFGLPLLDIELWALAAAPGLLAGSYVGFARGEAFRGKRRWVRPLALAAAMYLLVGLAYIGLARWGTRYDRAQVYRVRQTQVTGDGSVAGLISYGSPVEFSRNIEARLGGGTGEDSRRVYSVGLDLATGKELLVRRETGIPKVSPDGKRAALLTAPRPLTWRGEANTGEGAILEIWDLAGHRRLYRGVPAGSHIGSLLEWSPDGRWLVTVGALREPRSQRVLLLRLDGSVEYDFPVLEFGWYASWGARGARAWAFAPSGEAVYALAADGVLRRHDLARKRAQEIWTVREFGLDPEQWSPYPPHLVVSPDGARIAVAMLLRSSPRLGQPGARTVFVVMDADGSHSRIALETEEEARQFHAGQWSADSQRLFMLVNVAGQSASVQATKVGVWQASEPNAPAAIATLPTRGWPEARPLPDGRLLVVSAQRAWTVNARGEKQRLRGALGKTLAESEVAGVAKDGRLIVQMHEGYLAAVSLDTGQAARIYP